MPLSLVSREPPCGVGKRTHVGRVSARAPHVHPTPVARWRPLRRHGTPLTAHGAGPRAVWRWGLPLPSQLGNRAACAARLHLAAHCGVRRPAAGRRAPRAPSVLLPLAPSSAGEGSDVPVRGRILRRMPQHASGDPLAEAAPPAVGGPRNWGRPPPLHRLVQVGDQSLRDHRLKLLQLLATARGSSAAFLPLLRN